MRYEARNMSGPDAADLRVCTPTGTIIAGVAACDTDEGWLLRYDCLPDERLDGDDRLRPQGEPRLEVLDFDVIRRSTGEVLHRVRVAQGA